jgi:hypothetical protein
MLVVFPPELFGMRLQNSRLVPPKLSLSFSVFATFPIFNIYPIFPFLENPYPLAESFAKFQSAKHKWWLLRYWYAQFSLVTAVVEHVKKVERVDMAWDIAVAVSKI